MRVALAIVIAIFFAVVFIVSFIALRTVDTVGSPDRVAGIIEGSGAYDFVYDELIDAALTDVTTQGFDFEGGPTGEPVSITFRDPERAAAAIKNGIDTLADKEYVKAQVREALRQMIPYWTGQTDSFELQLDTADRIRTAPDVVRTINEEINFGQIITDQLVAPNVSDLSQELTLGPFGIAITEQEAQDAAARILPPEWVNDVIYEAVDEMTPYFAGDAETFAINIPLRGRVLIVSEILKEKVADEATAGSLVISRVAGPLISQAIGDTNFVGFNIQITNEEIETALEQVAPPEWVIEQANGVIDTLVSYLTGDSDSLTIVIDLSDRKGDAITALTTLAESKLRQQISNLPTCQNPLELAQAATAISSGQVPGCAPEGSEAAVPLMMPYVEDQIENLILDSMPDRFVYSDAQFRSVLGEDQTTVLDDARELITDGITFTEQDLIDAMAGDGEQRSPEDLENFEDTLNQIREGFSFTDADLAEQMGEDFEQVEQYRDQVGLAYSLRYLLYVLPFGLLGVVAFTGGHGWRGRGMWAGMTLFVVSLVLLLVFVIGASQGRSRVEPLLEDSYEVSDSTRQDYPETAALLDSGRVQQMALDGVDSFINIYRNGIIPFVVAGGVLFLAAAAYPKYGGSLRRSDSATVPGESGESPESERQSSDNV